jgi:hypothetical protein
MINKRGFEFSFAWLFAIIVGAVIIFIAIFAATQLIKTSRIEAETKVAAQLGILLNPIETSLEEAKYAVISFPEETRVFNTCRETGNFGRQILSTSVKTGFGDFQEPEVENFFFNKYVFSNGIEQGKKLNVLAKPFEMPYKVADLIFAYSGEFCFVNPPDDIEDEITDLNLAGINISSNIDDCPLTGEIVCFNIGDNRCDIDVNLQSQKVVKDGDELYYEDNLIYGAIFADSEIYECQVKRLMKRDAELAHLYASKTEFLSGKGCASGLASELRNFASITQEIENSQELLLSVATAADSIRRKNENLLCRLF